VTPHATIALATVVAALAGPARAEPVRTLEERVSSLRESTGAQRLLEQHDLGGLEGGEVAASGRVVLRHETELGSALRLVSVAYALDGEPVYAKTDVEGDLERAVGFEVFGGRLGTGPHALEIALVVLRHGAGHGRDAVRLEAVVTCPFEVTSRTVATLTVVVAGERARGGARPTVRCNVDGRPEPE
jgi:hypothetical protein